MKTTQAPEKDRPEELAILVHGTFAGADADNGENWWQSGIFHVKSTPPHSHAAFPALLALERTLTQ